MAHTIATPYGQLKEPWHPKIEREPVFNAFASPLARSGELDNLSPLEHPEAKGLE